MSFFANDRKVEGSALSSIPKEIRYIIAVYFIAVP